ncbi:MAG: bifunctional phosphoribosyl-AMP cyclohydrolase/phosphoribosyl-ATP diphosphatase HisIE [Ginsengibacter sp.]
MSKEKINNELVEAVNFAKAADGLVPVIIQDHETNKVLMLGYMDTLALQQTINTKLVTFFSRSKQRLWVKGETSNNFLHLVSITADCDNDTLLVKAKPDGPVCHTGTDTCFNEINEDDNFLKRLEEIILDRKENINDKSYTSSLFSKGINAIAQKVGEEAIELVIESKDNNEGLFVNEAADLLFHYLILLSAKGKKLSHVVEILKARHKVN